uniref:Uncharacterized protein n=1 Tax=Rhizophora mucronata TaxID=61149 RepID=A0A2P2KJP6_RHIMU
MSFHWSRRDWTVFTTKPTSTPVNPRKLHGLDC